jgi:hypothetical protein
MGEELVRGASAARAIALGLRRGRIDPARWPSDFVIRSHLPLLSDERGRQAT